MIKRVILAITTLVAVAAPITRAAAPADAAVNRPCITKGELNAVDVGMRRATVERVVGSLGRLTHKVRAYPRYHSPAFESYDIRHCGPSRVPAMVNFERRHGNWGMSYSVWKPARD